jgi:hypothetical protein
LINDDPGLLGRGVNQRDTTVSQSIQMGRSNMKRINLAGVALVAVLSLTGIMASSASAALCRKVDQAHTGSFSDRGCTHSESGGEYITVGTASNLISPSITCSQVVVPKTGRYETNKCSGEEKAGGEWILVFSEHSYVNSVELPAGSKAPLATKAVTDENAVFSAPGIKLKLTCASLEDNGGALVGENMGEASSLKFGGCSEVEPSTCKLGSPTIETEPVLATLSMDVTFPEDRVLLAPKTKSTLASIDLEGSCTLAGEELVTGDANIKLPTGQEELTGQAIEGLGSVENNSLMIAGSKVFLEKGKALLKLSSGSKFSFF